MVLLYQQTSSGLQPDQGPSHSVSGKINSWILSLRGYYNSGAGPFSQPEMDELNVTFPTSYSSQVFLSFRESQGLVAKVHALNAEDSAFSPAEDLQSYILGKPLSRIPI